MCPPCKPKMRSMPRALRNRAIQAAQESASAFRSWVASGSFMTCAFRARRYGSAAAVLLLQAQQAVLDLAGRRARHLLIADEAHRARSFISGDAAAAPFDDLDLGRRRAVARDDHRMHPLAPGGIGKTDDRHVPHLFV